MIQVIGADDPEDPAGRLKLLSGLVVLVDGEISRRSIARQRPPFWRRLASIAHAALIEREVLDAELAPTVFSEWALESGGAHYYMQSLVDLRQEPRWYPDGMTPKQLQAEMLGRVRNAAERYRKNVRSGELTSLLWGEGSAVQSRKIIPYAFLPGPLEASASAPRDLGEMPDKYGNLASEFESRKREPNCAPESFSELVNMSPRAISHQPPVVRTGSPGRYARVGRISFPRVPGNDGMFSLPEWPCGGECCHPVSSSVGERGTEPLSSRTAVALTVVFHLKRRQPGIAVVGGFAVSTARLGSHGASSVGDSAQLSWLNRDRHDVFAIRSSHR